MLSTDWLLFFADCCDRIGIGQLIFPTGKIIHFDGSGSIIVVVVF
jgi:hypothetical protein